MSRPIGASALVLACALAAVALTGCAAPWEARTAPAPHGAVGTGFIPVEAPAPEATLNPDAGSWEGLTPAPGYRVVLLTAGDDAPARTLVSAIEDWAAETGVDLRTVEADAGHVAGIVTAMDMNPDLIVSVGNELVDPLALVTPNHLDRQFLIVGAEIAEPTANVTAVDWTGAAYRGEGLGASSTYDAASFTPERAADAIRAGAAAVLSGLTGVVLWID